MAYSAFALKDDGSRPKTEAEFREVHTLLARSLG